MDNIPIQTLEDTYSRYNKNIYNYIAFRINNHYDAEELAAVVFEKAVKAWDGYNPNRPIEAWLIGIAKNTVTDYLRQNRKRLFVSLDSVVNMTANGKSPHDVVVANEENRALIAAMARLKNHERTVLSLKFATDLKHAEIAEIMGISEANTRVLTHRAIKKLRKFLQPVEKKEDKNGSK